VLADLCGPKIRVGELEGGGWDLAAGDRVTVHRREIVGRDGELSTTFPELVDHVREGDTLLLDDGAIRMEVVDASPARAFVCKVLVGGRLLSGKGINLPRTDLRVGALTDKDVRDAAWLAGRDVDWVALSFVQSASDVRTLRALLEEHGSEAHVVAKIEKPQALAHIEDIVDTSDGVMVARGDLGVEMDLPSVPVAQKRIARLAQERGKVCIIATQMLESMTTSATPTRAEVSDVANAVLDRADAVMLSGETAVGRHPVGAVRMMNEILANVQQYHDETRAPARVTWTRARTESALAAAVREILAHVEVAAVAAFTSSGTTARILSKYRLPCPIIAITQHERTLHRMTLYYGVEPVLSEAPEHTREVLATASREALERGLASRGDRLVVVTGRPIGRPGAANTLVLHEVGTPTGTTRTGARDTDSVNPRKEPT
jgi:pyruvate kinase